MRKTTRAACLAVVMAFLLLAGSVKSEENITRSIMIDEETTLSIESEKNLANVVVSVSPEGHQVNITITPREPVNPCQPQGRSRNCLDIQREGQQESGIYPVWPYDCCPDRKVLVYCDMDTDGGGWTVIQRRDKYPSQEDFYRIWFDYVEGFGNLNQEFWLGLDNIHALTNQSNCEARFDLGDFADDTRWAKYDYFNVDDEKSSYKLHFDGYTGDAGNAMDHQNNRKFSTKDKDNDDYDHNCAVSFEGAWWYGLCHNSNLNGKYYPEGNIDLSPLGKGIIWEYWRGNKYSLKKTEIKLRPKI